MANIENIRLLPLDLLFGFSVATKDIRFRSCVDRTGPEDNCRQHCGNLAICEALHGRQVSPIILTGREHNLPRSGGFIVEIVMIYSKSRCRVDIHIGRKTPLALLLGGEFSGRTPTRHPTRHPARHRSSTLVAWWGVHKADENSN